MTKKLDKFFFIRFTLFFVLFLFSAVSSDFVCCYLYAVSANDLDHYDGYDVNDYDNFYQDSNLILSKSDNLNYNSFSYANDYMLQELNHASYLSPTLVNAFLPAATKLNLTLSGILLSSLAIYVGNKFFFHHNSLGGIFSFDVLNNSSSLPEDFEPNNLKKSQHSMNNISDNTHVTDPKDSFFVLSSDQDDEHSNKDPHLSDLKVDAETLEFYIQRGQLKTEYKNALDYIDELKRELEKQIFKQKSKQVFIDYFRFILAVIDVHKQDYSKQVFDNVEYYELYRLKALDESKEYSNYYKAYIANNYNEDAFLNPKSRQKIRDHQFKAKFLKDEFKKYNGFMDFYSLHDYEFKLLGDHINDGDLKPVITDINYYKDHAKKVDRFDNYYSLKGSITRLNQSIHLSKFTSAKLLIDIDKIKLSVIHSDIVLNILNANILLNGLHAKKEFIRTIRQYLSDKQKEQDLSAISQDVLIASERLSSVKTQLNSLYYEYHDVEYEPSIFQEVTTKLAAIHKESIYVKRQLIDLIEKYEWDS